MFFELLSSQYAISIHTVGDFFLFRTVGDLEATVHYVDSYITYWNQP